MRSAHLMLLAVGVASRSRTRGRYCKKESLFCFKIYGCVATLSKLVRSPARDRSLRERTSAGERIRERSYASFLKEKTPACSFARSLSLIRFRARERSPVRTLARRNAGTRERSLARHITQAAHGWTSSELQVPEFSD